MSNRQPLVKAALLLLFVAATAASKELPLSVTERLLRLAEAPALFEIEPQQLIAQLEPVSGSANDSLAWKARWWLLQGWSKLGYPDSLSAEAEEWFVALTRAPWNTSEQLPQIAKWKEVLRQEPVSIRQMDFPSIKGDELLARGPYLWVQEEHQTTALFEGKSTQVPAGESVRFAGPHWLLTHSPARPALLNWYWDNRRVAEMTLPDETVWSVAFDDGRVASSGENWFQLQRGSQTLFRFTQSGLEQCTPLVDPYHPWVLLLDCPSHQRQLIDLTTGVTELGETVESQPLRQLFTPYGELRMQHSTVALHNSPYGNLLWKEEFADLRDIAYNRGRLYVRQGEEQLLLFDLQLRRLIGIQNGLPGKLFSGEGGVGVATPSGVVVFLRRDGTIKNIYHTGEAALQPPLAGGKHFFSLLKDGSVIQLDGRIDRVAHPSHSSYLLQQWEKSVNFSLIQELLEEEPGEPAAWRALAQNAAQQGDKKDSAVAYWERSLSNRLPSLLDSDEIEEWRTVWGAKRLTRLIGEPPFRAPLAIAGERLYYLHSHDGSLIEVDLKLPHTPYHDTRHRGISQLLSSGGRLFAATDDRRLLKWDQAGQPPSAEWRSHEEPLFVTLGDSLPYLLSSSDDSTVIRRFTDELHSSVVQKMRREATPPTHFAATPNRWAIGYSNGKIRGGSRLPTEQSEWEINVGQELVRLAYTGDTLIAGVAKSKLLLIDFKNGRLLGRLEASGDAGATTSILHSDKLIVSQYENGLFVVLQRGNNGPSQRLTERPGWQVSWAPPLWWKKNLLIPQPDGIWLVDPESFKKRRLAYLPSPPSSCLAAKEELICALESGWLVSFELPRAALIEPLLSGSAAI